jgi:hypothetical protein
MWGRGENRDEIHFLSNQFMTRGWAIVGTVCADVTVHLLYCQKDFDKFLFLTSNTNINMLQLSLYWILGLALGDTLW